MKKFFLLIAFFLGTGILHGFAEDDDQIMYGIVWMLGEDDPDHEIPVFATVDGVKSRDITSAAIKSSVTKKLNVWDKGLRRRVEKDISLPVKVICGSAFSYCSNLKSVSIPNSIIEIGDGAFHDCTSLVTLNLPSIEYIGDMTFSGCTSLTSIDIPSSVKEIGGSAFRGCSSLTHIDLKNVSTIGSNAFIGTSISSLVIPKSVTYLGGGLPELLEDVTINSSSWQTSWFQGLQLLRHAEVGRYVTTIPSNAFNKCEKLEYVTGMDDVTSIGAFAFKGCVNLQSFEIPSGVESIDLYTFSGCTNLHTMDIPVGVKKISSYAFQDCESLQRLSLPRTLEEIDNMAFVGCDNISSLIIDTPVCRKWFKGWKSLQHLEFGSHVRTIVDDAFQGCSGLEGLLNITAGITSIGEKSFSGCPHLEKVIIPSSVSEVAKSAFYQCYDIKELVLMEGIQTIGNYAFEGCKSLKSVIIPNSVTSIGVSAFEDCEALQEVILSERMEVLDKATFRDCINLVSIIVPEGITTINEMSFSNCTALAEVTVPSTLTNVGYQAFSKCANLQNFYCYALQVPEADGTLFFYSNYETATLWVCCSLLSEFKRTSPWKNFGQILSLDPDCPDSIESIATDIEITPKRIAIDGKQVTTLKGVQIIQQSDGATHKVLVK